MVTRVTILGSTGSIGTQALDVIRRGGAARFLVRGLSCGKNDALLARQIAEFGPAAVAVADEAGAARIREAFPRLTVFGGADAAERLAGFCGADVVLNALVGISGLRPTMAAIARLAEERAAGCRPYNSEKRATEGGRPYGYPATSRRTSLALANKESLVAGGRLVTEAAARAGVAIVPVDSEHSAIFQCLQASTGGAGVERLILTASGGPFRGRTRAALTHVTAADALKHPNWDMGSKVTIDSATLFNKGLEVIEARWLFGLPAERIEVLVHPQSIVHSMVAYRDGAVLAQLGVPDMKVPIAYALTFPERIGTGVPAPDFAALGALTFEKPDTETFRCLRVALDTLRAQDRLGTDSGTARLNGAAEALTNAFLAGRIGFLDIGDILADLMDAHAPRRVQGLEEILEIDAEARRDTETRIASR